jgi:hypothetical protein
MNDELQKQLLSWAQNAANFASTEVPELAQQYIHWQLFSSGGAAFFCLSVFIFCVAMIKQAAKEQGCKGLVVVLGVGAVGTFLGFSCNVGILVKCIVAPKLVLLDLLR